MLRVRSIGQVRCQSAPPEMQFHCIVFVFMSHRCQMFSRNNDQPRLFTAFANNARTWCFVRVAFAAGKFRLSGQRSAFRTNSYQNLPGRFDNGNGNFGCRQWRSFAK